MTTDTFDLKFEFWIFLCHSDVLFWTGCVRVMLTVFYWQNICKFSNFRKINNSIFYIIWNSVNFDVCLVVLLGDCKFLGKQQDVLRIWELWLSKMINSNIFISFICVLYWFDLYCFYELSFLWKKWIYKVNICYSLHFFRVRFIQHGKKIIL